MLPSFAHTYVGETGLCAKPGEAFGGKATAEIFTIATAGTYSADNVITVGNVADAAVTYTVKAAAAASTAALLTELGAAVVGAVGAIYVAPEIAGSVATFTALAAGAQPDATSSVTLGDTGVTVDAADVITKFEIADLISVGVVGSGATVTFENSDAFNDFTCFVIAEDAALNGTVQVYVAYDAIDSNNACVAVDRNGNGTFGAGDSLIELNGVSLVAEIAATNFIA